AVVEGPFAVLAGVRLEPWRPSVRHLALSGQPCGGDSCPGGEPGRGRPSPVGNSELTFPKENGNDVPSPTTPDGAPTASPTPAWPVPPAPADQAGEPGTAAHARRPVARRQRAGDDAGLPPAATGDAQTLTLRLRVPAAERRGPGLPRGHPEGRGGRGSLRGGPGDGGAAGRRLPA